MNPASVEVLLAATLLQWSVIIIAARLGGSLAVRLGQPPAVGEIAAGLALGPSLFGAVWPAGFEMLFGGSGEILRFLGKIGLILFLFHVGLNFESAHLRARSRAVVAISAAGMLVPFALGLAIAPWLQQQYAPEIPELSLSLFVGIAMSISALPIMARMLMELGLEKTPIGITALSSAAIDDLIGWIGLAAIAALVSAKLTGWMPLGQIAGLTLYALLLWKVVRPLHAWVLARHAPLSPGHCLFLVPALFLSCLCTYHLGVFSIFGAFALGIALHGQGTLEARWEERYATPVRLFLVPVFFTYTGLKTSLGTLDAAAWLGCAVVLALSVLGKFGGCYVAGRIAGLGHTDAGAVASLMNTRALMGLIAVNVGMEMGVLTPSLFSMFVLMCLLTTAMAAPLLRLFLGRQVARWRSVDGVRHTAPGHEPSVT